MGLKKIIQTYKQLKLYPLSFVVRSAIALLIELWFQKMEERKVLSYVYFKKLSHFFKHLEGKLCSLVKDNIIGQTESSYILSINMLAVLRVSKILMQRINTIPFINSQLISTSSESMVMVANNLTSENFIMVRVVLLNKC